MAHLFHFPYFKVVVPILAVATFLCFSSSSFAADLPNEKQTVGEVEEVLVIGEQSGPGLWKVFKDDHVLWILGTLSPLPKKLTWRSTKIEEVVKQSKKWLKRK